MRRALIVLTLLGTFAIPLSAQAQIQKSGPEVWPGKNELAVHLGFQNGLTGYSNNFGGSASGFKILADYSFRFTELLWLNFGVNFVFSGGCGNGFACGWFGNGNTVEPEAGIKLKFTTPIPLVPYAKFDVVFVGIYNRPCNDNGFALAGRASGGAKYFLLKNLGVGIETGFVAGPGFFSGAQQACTGFGNQSHVEFYAAIDFAAGAEFIF